MEIEAFLFDDGIPEGDRIFFRQFLGSPDFGLDAIKRISRILGISTTQSKDLQIEQIINSVAEIEWGETSIIECLIERSKDWMAIRKGMNLRQPSCNDPRLLLRYRGKEEWYGPVRLANESNVAWYIRPQFLDHWHVPESRSEPQHFIIRSLCFARVSDSIVSLHWRGFTHAGEETDADANKRFCSWVYIPRYFEELVNLLRSSLSDIDLHFLTIHQLWDRYRYDKMHYVWSDNRIRAQGEGVALSARAGATNDIDINGIKGLASTIRKSIQRELADNYGQSLPDSADQFDEVILRTLIKEFGALSYEFSLETADHEKLFRAHVYFGMRRKAESDDAFPHLRVYITWRDTLAQLQFLIDHLDVNDDAADTVRQPQLL